MESRFQVDLAQEHLLMPFLDRCYAASGFEVQRCHDLDNQHHGVDVRLTRGDTILSVDEKAQLHFVGRSLPTFALEIEYFLAGERRTGWLYDRQKRTDTYAFVFDIEVDNSAAELVSPDGVTNACVILVDRKRLRLALVHEGIFESAILSIAEQLRASTSSYRWIKNTSHKLVLSNHLVERPVNLVVRRKFLESIGETLQA